MQTTTNPIFGFFVVLRNDFKLCHTDVVSA
jgi:hypothetical protein